MEATPAGCGRHPVRLRELSDRLDLHIICATGWYREENHPDDIIALGASGRTDILLRELALGIGDTGIRPGFIKVAASQELTPEEEITLRAAARAQREAKVGLAVHVTNTHETDPESAAMPAAHMVLDILEHEGADLDKVCLCHSDGTYFDRAKTLPVHFSLLGRGVYLSYDQFSLNPIPEAGVLARPAEDAERIRAIVDILESDASYIRRLLLSQDVSTYEQLSVSHGSAYSHLLETVRPQLLAAGLDEDQVEVLLISNPANFLATPALPVYTHRSPVRDYGKSAWYWHRAVRSQANSGGLLFPPEHVPVLSDPAMQGLTGDELYRVLAVHLATLLRFTVWLELNPVLQVAKDIFEGRYPRLVLPEPTRQTALKIMSDEVSHTDLAFEYLRELERTITLPDLAVEHVWKQRLDTFVEQTDADYSDIACACPELGRATRPASIRGAVRRGGRVGGLGCLPSGVGREVAVEVRLGRGHGAGGVRCSAVRTRPELRRRAAG
jgi:phosphotriesterase-related protein